MYVDFLNRKASPEFHTHTAKGYLIGHWEDDTLVVETTLLLANVRGGEGLTYF